MKILCKKLCIEKDEKGEQMNGYNRVWRVWINITVQWLYEFILILKAVDQFLLWMLGKIYVLIIMRTESDWKLFWLSHWHYGHARQEVSQKCSFHENFKKFSRTKISFMFGTTEIRLCLSFSLPFQRGTIKIIIAMLKKE